MFNFSIKTFCILLLLLTNTLADKIKAIDVVGNDRLSKETIILFSDLSVGQDYNPNILNNSIKKLYSTDFFENINISSHTFVNTQRVQQFVDLWPVSCQPGPAGAGADFLGVFFKTLRGVRSGFYAQ